LFMFNGRRSTDIKSWFWIF